MMKYRHALMMAAAASLAAVGGLAAWAGSGLYNLRLTKQSVRLSPAGETASPVRLGLLADLHAGAWEGEYLDKAVRLLAEQKPDAILLLGDYRYCLNYAASMSPEEVARHLEPLMQVAPVYFVCGNHDGDAWGADMRRCLREAGAHGLENHTVRIWNAEGRAIDLFGLPYVGIFGPGLGKRLEGKRNPDAPLVAVAHDTYEFRLYPADADLIIGGHTHGGQICAPNGRPLFSNFGRPAEVQRKGLARSASGKPMYTSAGIGVSTLPARICCPPQVDVLELR